MTKIATRTRTVTKPREYTMWRKNYQFNKRGIWMYHKNTVPIIYDFSMALTLSMVTSFDVGYKILNKIRTLASYSAMVSL